jgi:hypothetical protein
MYMPIRKVPIEWNVDAAVCTRCVCVKGKEGRVCGYRYRGFV